MNKPSILIINETVDDADSTSLLLQTFGLSVTRAEKTASSISLTQTELPPVLLLESTENPQWAIDCCQTLRPTYKGGIIILCSKADEVTELAAFNAGVDDFIIRPVRPHLLLARINALISRLANAGEYNFKLQSGAVSVDFRARLATFNEHPLKLTDAEFEILTILAENSGHVVSRELLCESLKGCSYNGLARFIDVRVSNLRRKISALYEGDAIKTVRGKGYMLCDC